MTRGGLDSIPTDVRGRRGRNIQSKYHADPFTSFVRKHTGSCGTRTSKQRVLHSRNSCSHRPRIGRLLKRLRLRDVSIPIQAERRSYSRPTLRDKIDISGGIIGIAYP